MKVHTILVLNVLPAFAEDVVDEDELRVARVGHPMVADEDDVEDVCEVACLDLVMQLARKDVNLLQDFLQGSEVSAEDNVLGR